LSKTTSQRGSEEARNQLPRLIDAAASGRATIITRRGKPVAALVPLDTFRSGGGQQSMLGLEGSGSRLWGRRSSQTIRKLRDEWSR
jgi:prevent-host-death family protein